MMRLPSMYLPLLLVVKAISVLQAVMTHELFTQT